MTDTPSLTPEQFTTDLITREKHRQDRGASEACGGEEDERAGGGGYCDRKATE